MTDQDIHNEQSSSSDDQPIEATSQASPKPKRLWGWWIFVILFGVYIFFNLMPMVGIVYNSEMYTTDLYSMKHDLFDYVERHHQFPLAEEWCDTLVEEDDVDAKIFSYLKDFDEPDSYGRDKDDFPCILNKHILDHKELPGNMVVAFFGGNAWEPETSGWNQVGDIEQVKDYDRVAVLFGNGEMFTFRKKLAPYLRWRFEDSGVIPKPYLEIPFLMMTTLLSFVFLAIVITCHNCLKFFWLLALVTGTVSAFIGAYLGGLAVRLFYLSNFTGYYLSHTEYLIIPWVCPIVGFVTGVCFISVLGKIYMKYHANVNMVSYAIVLGPLTGIAVSSIVHGYLMIAYGETGFRYMLAGSFFGIIAGGILGLIGGALINLYKDKLPIQNEEQKVIHAVS